MGVVLGAFLGVAAVCNQRDLRGCGTGWAAKKSVEDLNAHQQMPIINDTVVELPLKTKTLNSIKMFQQLTANTRKKWKDRKYQQKNNTYKEEPNGNVRTEIIKILTHRIDSVKEWLLADQYFPGRVSLVLSSKESACQCTRLEFHPWIRKIPWRRKRQPTPVFLPGKSQGQRSL